MTAVLHNTAVPASAPLGVRKEEEGEPRYTIYALKLVCTVCNNLTTTLFFVCTNTNWFSYLQNLLYLCSAFIEYCFNYLKKIYYTLHETRFVGKLRGKDITIRSIMTLEAFYSAWSLSACV